MLSVNRSRIDVGILARAAGKHRTRKVRIEASEQFHHFASSLTKMTQSVALFVGLIELLIGAQGVLHFVVIGKVAGIGRASLARCLAFRQRVVVDAIDGHQPCRQMGDTFPHLPVVVPRHVLQYNWSLTSSGGLGESPPSLSGALSCSGGTFS